MRFFIFFVLFFLMFFYCSKDVEVPAVEMPPPLSNVCKLELTFGDDEVNLKKEFLLAAPRDLAVNNEDDIFVVDEQRVKIFDSNGKEKSIIGGPGQGPGDFERNVISPMISPIGYLTVLDGGKIINEYDLSNKFIKKVNTRFSSKYNRYMARRSTSPGGFIIGKAYKVAEKIILDYTARRLNYYTHHQFAIVCDYADTLVDIAYYDVEDFVDTGGSVSGKPFHGSLYWDILPGNRVVFTHPQVDKNSDTPYYILHIKSFDTFEETKISHPYNLVEIPYSAKKRYVDIEMYSGQDKIWAKILKKIAEDTKFFLPLQRLLTDRDYIFAYTYQQNDKQEILVDIFNSNTGEHVSSAYFPEKFNVIRNGYAYFLKTGIDIFPVVEKYRIDPAVYGK